MHRCLKIGFASALVLALASSGALAHPGHGGGIAGGLAHPLTGLDHLLAMVAVGLWASQLGRRAVVLLPIVFPAAMVAGALLAASGTALPWVEAAIAASVIVLGASVALRIAVPLVAGAAVVGLFALFHGFAHGVEWPGTGSPLLYGAGFVAATVALHAVGIGVGMIAQRQVMRAAGGAIAALGLVLALV